MYKSKVLKTEYKMSKEKREYYKKYKKKYRAEGRDKTARTEHDREYHRNYQRKAREMVIAHYGGKCECCNENQIQFLAVDHINGGGGQHRKMIGGKITNFIIKNKFPKGYRILCHNCNMSLGIYGNCPHKELTK